MWFSFITLVAVEAAYQERVRSLKPKPEQAKPVDEDKVTLNVASTGQIHPGQIQGAAVQLTTLARPGAAGYVDLPETAGTPAPVEARIRQHRKITATVEARDGVSVVADSTETEFVKRAVEPTVFHSLYDGMVTAHGELETFLQHVSTERMDPEHAAKAAAALEQFLQHLQAGNLAADRAAKAAAFAEAEAARAAKAAAAFANAEGAQAGSFAAAKAFAEESAVAFAEAQAAKVATEAMEENPEVLVTEHGPDRHDYNGALASELRDLSLKALIHRALDEGLEMDQIAKAEKDLHAKSALIELILDHAAAAVQSQ